MKKRPGQVLSIAGSDPSGGAGIQADLKTFNALGVYGGAVVTCLTVQNTEKVYRAEILDPGLVREQAEAVLNDLDITHVKTGMLGNAAVVEAVGSLLEGRFIVCDPVMISKSGYPLLLPDAVEAMKHFIFPKTALLTPNSHELRLIVGRDDLSHIDAGMAVLEKYPAMRGLLVKAGHIDEEGKTVTDVLIYRDGPVIRRHSISHPRVKTKNTHGTGCTLSSAITAYLARGESLPSSVEKAVQWVARLIRYSKDHPVGHGHGPLIHYQGNV